MYGCRCCRVHPNVYVHWTWQHNAHALEEIDEDQARARTCTLLLLRLVYYLPLTTDH